MSRIIIILFAVIPVHLMSQTIEGKVTNNEGGSLFGANVQWIDTAIGTSTDKEGTFSLSSRGIKDKRLVVSYVGFKSDTVVLQGDRSLNIKLGVSHSMEEVEVKEERPGSFVSSINPVKTEVITSGELEKGACCDLAGCFNTQSSVEPTTTNIVTDAKELRILGLSGVYNQILIDGLPMMIRGLPYTYGVSSIPGTLVENIYIAQGANSVLQGFESISGQINVQLKDGSQKEMLLFNAYMNSFLEKQFNVNFAKQWDEWSTLLAAHTTQPGNKFDRDDDTFLDLPLLTRYSVYNNWTYGDPSEWGWHAKASARFVHERRIGGQMDFDPDRDEGTTRQYGQTIRYDQEEIYLKGGYRAGDKHHFVFHGSALRHDQRSYFGTLLFDAAQTNAYGNLQYELSWKKQHQFKTGLSFRYVNLDEQIAFGADSLGRTYDGAYDRREYISGLFAENVFNWNDRQTTLITGIRFDHHNEFGWYVTPRALIKHNISEQTTARASFGTGWRTVQLFSENVNLLASSRNVIIREELQPEEAVNYGLNITHKVYGEEVESQLTLDVYQTRFSNQIFPDYDEDPTIAYVSNFKGTSISNAIQAEIGFDLIDRIGLKLSYNYLDVFREIEGEKVQLPFNSKHRLKSSISFNPLSRSWHFDLNAHWYGPQRLANTDQLPSEFQQAEYSESHMVINAQFTRTWDRLEIYFGCENIFDFRQHRPILSWEQPFGPYFDTSSVWGPTRGREFYLGVRYRIPKNNGSK